ncbi:MAG: Kae1-associated serine/threonine protein kinase [Candidatus Lokiarchaeota archaeon]|nr:Kae1-associated serine/threonine protein kinase [Candidatus Lokiarchaeota archaeon]
MNLEIEKKKIFKKGAEASLYYGKWFNKDVIFKYRISKKYRLDIIDKKIRNSRTLNEARALIKIKNYGINVPCVYEIDPEESIITMDYIPGEKLKDLISILDIQKLEDYFKKVGIFIGILHQNGHIHGDITTSNILITPNKEVFLIDFGLHDYSDNIEDKSVDIHLLKRVLISSHGDYYKICFKAFLEGYRDCYNESSIEECESIILNVDVIETRGRYIKKEERL